MEVEFLFFVLIALAVVAIIFSVVYWIKDKKDKR